MTKRTDLAAPTVIDPAAFTFVAGVYFGKAGEEFDALLGDWMAEKSATGGDGWFNKRSVVREAYPMLAPEGNFMRKGTCDHCGARFDWGAVYQHTSGAHIVVGNVCADKTLSVPNRHELDVRRLKARIAAQRETERNNAKARTEALAGGYEWLYTGAHDNATLTDIARKGLTWGGLTVAQVALVKRIHDGTPAEWEVKKAAREAVRAAEEAAADPVPVTADRIEIEGEVLTVKSQEGYLGQTVLKMLVRTTKGYKLWGSVPSVLLNDVCHDNAGNESLRGKRVSFSAKVERSKDDAKFGFFSRPTKARVVPVNSETARLAMITEEAKNNFNETPSRR